MLKTSVASLQSTISSLNSKVSEMEHNIESQAGQRISEQKDQSELVNKVFDQ